MSQGIWPSAVPHPPGPISQKDAHRSAARAPQNPNLASSYHPQSSSSPFRELLSCQPIFLLAPVLSSCAVPHRRPTAGVFLPPPAILSTLVPAAPCPLLVSLSSSPLARLCLCPAPTPAALVSAALTNPCLVGVTVPHSIQAASQATRLPAVLQPAILCGASQAAPLASLSHNFLGLLRPPHLAFLIRVALPLHLPCHLPANPTVVHVPIPQLPSPAFSHPTGPLQATTCAQPLPGPARFFNRCPLSPLTLFCSVFSTLACNPNPGQSLQLTPIAPPLIAPGWPRPAPAASAGRCLRLSAPQPWAVPLVPPCNALLSFVPHVISACLCGSNPPEPSPLSFMHF